MTQIHVHDYLLDKLTKNKLNSTACFDAGFDDLTTRIIYLTETYFKYHSKSLHRHFPEMFYQFLVPSDVSSQNVN